MQIFEIDRAHDLAMQLNDEDDEGWRYDVVPLGNEKPKVEAYDEDGYLAGTF